MAQCRPPYKGRDETALIILGDQMHIIFGNQFVSPTHGRLGLMSIVTSG